MTVVSIQVGPARLLTVGEQTVRTAIAKHPVERAEITSLGLVGDTIANTEHHGGPDQAVYLYGADDRRWWEAELGVDIAPGSFGENVVVDTLGPEPVRIGDRHHLGAVVLEVAAPRIPCAKLSATMGRPDFRKRFRAARRPGAYCRVLEAGTIAVGDPTRREPAPEANVTMLEIFDLYYDRSADPDRLRAALASPVAERFRDDLEHRLARSTH